MGSSTMYYHGNRAEETFELTITGPSTVKRTAAASSNGSIFPRDNTHTTPGFGLTAPKGSCGHLAELASRHFATTTIWISWQGFNANTVTEPGGAWKRQPDCACSGGGPGDEPVLNSTPNFTPSAMCSGDGGGGGGGGGGSNFRCYSVTIEHYYYHPATGEVEYRYTEHYSYCEQIE